MLKKKKWRLYGCVMTTNNDKKQKWRNYKSPLSFYIRNGFEVLMKEATEIDLILPLQYLIEKTITDVNDGVYNSIPALSIN